MRRRTPDRGTRQRATSDALLQHCSLHSARSMHAAHRVSAMCTSVLGLTSASSPGILAGPAVCLQTLSSSPTHAFLPNRRPAAAESALHCSTTTKQPLRCATEHPGDQSRCSDPHPSLATREASVWDSGCYPVCALAQRLAPRLGGCRVPCNGSAGMLMYAKEETHCITCSCCRSLSLAHVNPPRCMLLPICCCLLWLSKTQELFSGAQHPNRQPYVAIEVHGQNPRTLS